MLKRLYIFALMCIVGAACLNAANVTMSVIADRGKRVIEVGDRFYIRIDVSNVDGTPSFPSTIPGAKVMFFENTGQSSQTIVENGRASHSVTSIWMATLRANQEGSFSFGPVSVGGVKSNKISYSIGKAEPAPSNVPSGGAQASAGQSNDGKPKFIGKGDGNLFLRASVSQSNVYEQQALVYTVKLYTTYDAIKFIGATAAPKFEGFVVEEAKTQVRQMTYETVNGKTYAAAEIARYIIFPQMTGQLKVTGNTYTVSVDQREYYHDPFFGSLAVSTPLQLNVTPNDLLINVRALPTPKPADFSGGVGKFNISSQLKSRSFKTNQAASIVYTVTGVGNLKYLQLPDLAMLYPSNVEVYSPTTDVKAVVGSSNVSGAVTFDYSFMPLEEGNVKLPPVKLVYFNPETGKYETTESRGYELNVEKGSGSAKSQTKAGVRFDSKLEQIDMSNLSIEHVPYVSRFAFWLMYIIPVLLLVGVYCGYRYYENEHSDMVAFNSKRANKLARRRLKRAFACMRRNDSDGFYDELLIALWGYLGDKLKMPTSELMRDNIKAVLEANSIPETTISRLVEVIDNAEFAKYAPSAAKGGMTEAYNNAIEVINELENEFKGVKEMKSASNE